MGFHIIVDYNEIQNGNRDNESINEAIFNKFVRKQVIVSFEDNETIYDQIEPLRNVRVDEFYLFGTSKKFVHDLNKRVS